MVQRKYDLTVQVEGIYEGFREWTGEEMQLSWALDNINDLSRGQWTTNSAKWLQFSTVNTDFAMRYNALDINNDKIDVETIIIPGGTTKYEVGLMFCYTSRTSFYMVTMNGGYQNWGGKNIRLMRKTGTTYRKIAEYECPTFTNNKEYKFRVTAVNGIIKVYLDDVLIITGDDSASPLLKGASGPIVKGQEFARWKYFKFPSNTPFIIQKLAKDFTLDDKYTSISNSQLVTNDNIQVYTKDVIDSYLSQRTVTGYNITRYFAMTNNSRVAVSFDKSTGATTTTNGSNYLYAYQTLPTVAPAPASTLIGQAMSHSEIAYSFTHDGDDVDGFYLYDENMQLLRILPSGDRSFVESGLSEYTTYRRQIVAYNVAGQSAPSNLAITTTKHLIPAAPTDLVGEGISPNKIKWSWTDNAFKETRFELIDISTGVEVVIARIPADQTSYIEDGLAELSTHSRYIRVVNTAGTSGLSNEATATTTEILPDPPQYAPFNFQGIGVAHDKIKWGWLDKNDPKTVTGFVFFDENDKEILRIPYLTLYYEGALASSMRYTRKIAAYNKGGIGPFTPVMTAWTLPYGYDTGDAPNGPTDLIVTHIDQTSAVLSWAHEKTSLLDLIGFNIYSSDDFIVGTTNGLTFTLEGLTPDTGYAFYVVGYNNIGESMPSNTAYFYTEEEPEPEDDTLENEDGTFVDVMDGITFDKENEQMRIEAFASGVGDGLDLLVRNEKNLQRAYEDFNVRGSIFGRYLVAEDFYPDVPFSYEIQLTSALKGGGTKTLVTPSVSQTVRDGEQRKMYHGTSYVDGITRDMNVKASDFKMIVKDEFGSVIANGANNLFWSHDVTSYTESVGFVNEVEMKDVSSDWQKFTNSGTGRFDSSSSNNWRYNSSTGEMMSNANVEMFRGALTPDQYANYNLTVDIRSDEHDNDCMAIVLAYVVVDGKHYNLTAVRRMDKDIKWAIIYNYSLAGERILDYKAIDGITNKPNWSQFYPAGTTVNIKRDGDIIRAEASPIGSNIISSTSRLEIDLSTHPDLEKFKGAQNLGIGAYSQNDARIKITSFTGDLMGEKFRNVVTVWTNKKETIYRKEDWFGRPTSLGPYRITEGEQPTLDCNIRIPIYESTWTAINKLHKFSQSDYQLSVSTDNPNVELELISQPKPDQFENNQLIYLDYKVRAKIINRSQTPWHPQIHNGYYYLNQREHFLYSETKVRPEEGNEVEKLQYHFPYDIHMLTERVHKGGLYFHTETAASEFVLGTISPELMISFTDNSFGLNPDFDSGEFISQVIDFSGDISDWTPSELETNNPEFTEIEIADVDDFGNVKQWYKLANAPLLNRIRYKVKLKKGSIFNYFDETHKVSNADLPMGNHNVTQAVAHEVIIKDSANNVGGTFVSKPFTFITKVDSFGELSFDIIQPAGSKVTVYTVSGSEANHNYVVPTANNPWIPATLIKQDGARSTYNIASAANQYLAIVLVMERGTNKETPRISNMEVIAHLKDETIIHPVVYSAKLGGHMSDAVVIKDYVVPMTAELFSDQSWYEVTPNIAQLEVSNYMLGAGITMHPDEVVKEYRYEVDPALPVELKGHYMGQMRVEARVNSQVGAGKIIEKEITLKDGKAIIRPIPQNGKPIVIYNSAGQLLRQVHNRNENLELSLDFEKYEDMSGHTRYVFLRHTVSEIDTNTLKVLTVDEKGKWTFVIGASVKENRIILPETFKKGTRIKVTYRLQNSYIVDYNFDTDRDYARITVHMDYNEAIEATKVLRVYYETNKQHQYYIAEEVDLNPLKNKDGGGFIYLTEVLDKPETIDLHFYRSVTATKKESIIIHAYLLDKNKNPVVDKTISIKASSGIIKGVNILTDANGLAIYEFQSETSAIGDITITAEHQISSTEVIVKSDKLSVLKETYKTNVVIVPQNNEFVVGGTVNLMIKTVGENFEPVQNKTLTLFTSSGTLSNYNVTTNHVGEIMVTFNHSGLADDKLVMIEAYDGTIKEGIILGLKEV